MTTSMTSRERVNRMFARQDQDRTPRWESFWPEVLDNWIAQGLSATGREDAKRVVYEKLDADLAHCGIYWPHPFHGREDILEETEETKVVAGPSGTIERKWKNKTGVPEHVGWECSSREIWEEKFKPALVDQPISIDIDGVRKGYEDARRRDKWAFVAGVETFEAARLLIGDETLMISVLDDPEWIADISKTITDNLLRNYQAVLDAGIELDGIWIYGDMAFKTMMFCSPDTYKEVIWPDHKRIIDFIHENGMKQIFHTDGAVHKAIPLFIEAGFDCIQPLEAKAGMDVRELAPEYGDKLGFVGNIDVMVLRTNDMDAIEEEISTKLEAGKACKGYMYHSDHSVPPDVTWETYRKIIKLVEKYGRYS